MDLPLVTPLTYLKSETLVGSLNPGLDALNRTAEYRSFGSSTCLTIGMRRDAFHCHVYLSPLSPATSSTYEPFYGVRSVKGFDRADPTSAADVDCKDEDRESAYRGSAYL